MFKAAEECEYLDYDYLSNEEARYQGYDTDDDSDFADGFTVTEFEQKNEPGKDPEKNNNSNFPLEKCCNSRWFLAQQVIF